MLRRGRKLPAVSPIPGIGMIEQKSTFDVVVASKVRRDGQRGRDRELEDEDDMLNGEDSKNTDKQMEEDGG